MYSPRKVTQMAAFFSMQQGDCIDAPKLVHLLYLADRESLARYGRPITYDRPVSMPHGPTLVRTLGLVTGLTGGLAAVQWGEWMSDQANHAVAIKRKFDRPDCAQCLDELSNADLEVLEAVGHRFGGMDPWALQDWMRGHCPEWTDPRGSATPIDDGAWLRSVGTPEAQVSILADEMRTESGIDKLFGRL